MAKWQNFYLQKMGVDGSTYPVCESVKTWGVWCKDIPFKLFGDVKKPSSYTWHDEDGDDEYIPEGGLRLSAYSIDVEFGCKVTDSEQGANVDDVRENVGSFLRYLRQSGMMNMYSSFTRIGRRYVRMESYDNGKFVSDITGYSVENGEPVPVYDEFLTFKVKFKVNDPITDIVLSDD